MADNEQETNSEQTNDLQHADKKICCQTDSSTMDVENTYDSCQKEEQNGSQECCEIEKGNGSSKENELTSDSSKKDDKKCYLFRPKKKKKKMKTPLPLGGDVFRMTLYPPHDINYFFYREMPAVNPKWQKTVMAKTLDRYLVYVIMLTILMTLAMSFYTHYMPYTQLEPKMEFSSECGLYTGVWSDDMTVFRLYSVPYAVQPTIVHTTELARNFFKKYKLGLRWTSAKSIEGEESCMAAHSNNCFFKNRWECYFTMPSDVATCTKGVRNKLYSGSIADDACLTLNIARPGIGEGTNIPIIFLITGFLGVYNPMQPPLFTSKSYEPDNIAIEKSGCLWVSVNYRLGINGHFLDLYDSSSEVKDFALTDLKVALEWIKRNAKDFGADPKKITILAQGSASTLVIALIEKYELTRDKLFQQAWLSSGPVHWATSYEETYSKEIIDDFIKKYVPNHCELKNLTHFCRNELFKRTKKFLNPDFFVTYDYALDPVKIFKNILDLGSIRGWLSASTNSPLKNGGMGLQKYMNSMYIAFKSESFFANTIRVCLERALLDSHKSKV